ncbi:MAG: alkaline phosphatase family protein [Deltaproteobacteria bacterium]|jgi:predicted AlkP superfamily phosphohydrolase/phosphomutase|nr:alkaline phosphatase family protein [Deltaproteobacteria bacterium]
MQAQAPRPLIVLGLDGLPLDLAHKLANDGVCPHLARLTPCARSIQAELPELSPVNWTSFFTASGPEHHGVFGFTRINPQTYELGIVNFSQVSLPTLWDRLGEAGYRSRVVNLPNTYPARPLRGMMVSGFVAQERSGALYPPFLNGVLRDYVLESDTSRGGADPEYLLAGLRRSLASRRKAFELLWRDQNWQLFILVLTETDRLFHFLWHAVVDPAHPLHAACADFLREWDACIGLVADVAATLDARLMALADHGFAALTVECDLNAWLRDQGLLVQTLPPEKSPELDGLGVSASGSDAVPSRKACANGCGTPRHSSDGLCIHPRSAAFALDPGRIYLHARRRFAKGSLSDEEAARLLPRLCNELRKLRWMDAPVFSDLFTAEELYDGPMSPYAPDLVCVPAGGFDLKAKFNRQNVFGHFGRSGAHTREGGFFYDGEGSAPARLRDAGVLVTEHFGL